MIDLLFERKLVAAIDGLLPFSKVSRLSDWWSSSHSFYRCYSLL